MFKSKTVTPPVRARFLLIGIITLLFVPTSASAAQLAVGGLMTPAVGVTLAPNSLENGDFSDGTSGWKFLPKCFSLDPTTLAPNGAVSMKLNDPATCNHANPSAVNSVKAQGGGYYTVSAQIMTENFVSSNAAAGVRLLLTGAGAAPRINGTTAWTTSTFQHAAVAEGKTGIFEVANYGYPKPSGAAWFANLTMQQELPPPLTTFLLYPNYRGLMFSDQSQVASFALAVNPVGGVPLSEVQVELDAVDAAGNIVAAQSFSPDANQFTATLDMGALPPGTYQVSGKLMDAGGKLLLQQSAYSIVKLDASARADMKAWIDPGNRAHFIDGNQHFVLGIYDTTQYSLSASYYLPRLTAIARAPINMIINYYISSAPTSAIKVYTTAMQSLGMVFLPTVSNFYPTNPAIRKRWRRIRHHRSQCADFRFYLDPGARYRRGRLLRAG